MFRNKTPLARRPQLLRPAIQGSPHLAGQVTLHARLRLSEAWMRLGFDAKMPGGGVSIGDEGVRV